MNIYQPTWLYIKQHAITGLKYFGKTTKDPYRYKGSGKYWLRHLAKHGTNVITLWAQRFDDKEALVEYALRFSKENHIVESKEWANFVPENGLTGGAPGHTTSIETRRKISESLSGIPTPGKMTADGKRRLAEFMRAEHAKRPRLPMKGKKHTDDAKSRNAESNRNRPRTTCPHCGKSCQRGTYTRWHGDNCKLRRP